MIDNNDARSFFNDYGRTMNEAISFFAGAIRRHLLAIILITLFATGAGAYWWYSRPAHFESELVCGYNNERFGRKTFGEMVRKLDILAQSGSSAELGRVLGLSPNVTSRILSFDARNRSGSALHEDVTPDHQDIYIRVKATDRSVFPPLQEALVRFLSGSPHQKQIGAVQLAKINRQIVFAEADLRKVDSAIDAYVVAIRAGLVFRDTVSKSSDLTDILNYKRELVEQLSSLEWRRTMESVPSIVVIHGFAPPDRPTRGSKKIIAGAAMLGLMAALGWAMLRGHKREAHA